MHPLLLGRLRTALYFAVWVGIAALLAAILVLIQPRPLGQALAFAGPLTLAYAFVCLSAWWVCRAHPLGGAPPVELLGKMFGVALQASALWTAAGALWAVMLARAFHIGPDRMGIFRDVAVLFVAGTILYSESIIAHYFVLAFESARAAERRLYESQVTAREAELRALRAQLNPHFLFNSLNSISALAGGDPEQARRMCQLLGDFLRSSLALGGRERVALSEELALAERYLSIEQVRFGERLSFEKRIARDTEACLIPPLLIQPLIENAVKHGVADRVEGGTVEIEARRVGDSLEVSVENPFDPEAPPRRGQGLGLENVAQRLRALDPRGTRMDVFRELTRFRVVLTLPAIDALAAAPESAAQPVGLPAARPPTPSTAPTALLPPAPRAPTSVR